LSGALLIPKDEPIKTFFAKRASKIIIPLVFWSYAYILFARNFSYLDPAHANPNVYIQPWLILKHPAYFHLWFLYAIIGVYIMMPILRAIGKSTSLTTYAVVLWALWFSVLPFVQTFGYLNGHVFVIFKLDVIPLWSGFALLGHFISTRINNISAPYGWLMFIAGLIATVNLTSMASSNSPSELYQTYYMPNIILMASGVYIIFNKINFQPRHYITKLSALSFGVYLCHMLIMPVVCQAGILSNESLIQNGALPAIASGVITFILSATTAWLISSIQFVKRVV
jgi:surface polysaccharide O-acyltransferase-like enzyme